MSGIMAIAGEEQGGVSECLLRSLLSAMAFRGPHGSWRLLREDVALGFTYLHLGRTRQGNAQPLSSDGLYLVADVRLDGRHDLMARLDLVGRQESNLTDEDLILSSYKKWGEECVNYLRGDFTFALWDSRNRYLFCARDPFGVKPLYYAGLHKGILVSNTLQVLRSHPAIGGELNEQAIGDFLLFGSNQNLSTTLFSAIHRLPPGHCLRWNNGQHRISRYWSLPGSNPKRYRGRQDCIDDFLDVFDRAIADRLDASRASIFMSGGLDSTAIAALASKHCDLKAFTIVYDSLFRDEERSFAGSAANSIAIPIEYHVADEERPFAEWESWNPPQPVDEPMTAGSLNLVKKASRHAPIILTGHGGDALFHTDPAYMANLLRKGKIVTWLAEVCFYLWSRWSFPPLGIRTLWKSVTHQEENPDAPVWLNAGFLRRIQWRERMAESRSRTRSPIQPHHSAHNFLQMPLWVNHFEGYDGTMTGMPVEFCHPMFDHRLIEFVFGLPLLPWTIDKDLLRISMKGILPESVRQRKKKLLGGDPCRSHWQQEKWEGPAKKLVDSSVLPYILEDKVKTSLQRYLETGEDSAIVRVFCLQRWLRLSKSSHRQPPNLE